MDTFDLEEKYGRVFQRNPPFMATLSIRALHKAGVSFARGESDGDVIIQKVINEAVDKENVGTNS